MDLISLLPTEVAQNILLYLNVKDLFNCMTVCNYWRDLINCNYIWGRFYEIYGLEEVLDFDETLKDGESEALSPLCSSAVVLKKFVLSPAFNWRFGRSNNFYINLKYRQWKVACYKPYIAVMYLSLNELHVFCCSKKSMECIDIISVNLPQNSLEQPILINSKYIVLGSYNITFVYKIIDGHFKLYKMFALKCNTVIYNADLESDEFVKRYILSNHAVLDRILMDDIVWITDVSGIKHILNLNTSEKITMTNLPINTEARQNSIYVLNYVDVIVSISNVKGVIISSFTVSHGDTTFHMNAVILVVCFPRVIENEHYEIECREIVSGKLLRKLSVHERTRVTLDPKKNIIYLLSTQPDVYAVTSICMETGSSLWYYEVNCGPHMFWGSFLSVINDRFLFVYPAPSSDEFYALFNLQGKFLCHGQFTKGILLYFSDSIVLAKEGGRLNLSTFF